ncbi:MAG: DUF1653 domain-containing protein [Lachnospiraceae bacterium]|nr:DUF1653 domain-containing protein [Lachnospiraceae bacterium]
MRELPKENETYRHFKGNNYMILTLAKHSETGEDMVVYKALYGDGQVYVRPLAMFMEPVDRVKYPEATQQYRFEKVEAKIDPEVEAFLDAPTAIDRIRILNKIRPRLTDEMIDIMAIALDLEIGKGDIESRYADMLNCLNAIARFETNRLR